MSEIVCGIVNNGHRRRSGLFFVGAIVDDLGPEIECPFLADLLLSPGSFFHLPSSSEHGIECRGNIGFKRTGLSCVVGLSPCVIAFLKIRQRR